MKEKPWFNGSLHSVKHIGKKSRSQKEFVDIWVDKIESAFAYFASQNYVHKSDDSHLTSLSSINDARAISKGKLVSRSPWMKEIDLFNLATV